MARWRGWAADGGYFGSEKPHRVWVGNGGYASACKRGYSTPRGRSALTSMSSVRLNIYVGNHVLNQGGFDFDGGGGPPRTIGTHIFDSGVFGVPVLYNEPGNPSELAGVPRDQHRALRHGGACDEVVERPDWYACNLHGSANGGSSPSFF
jgi:hypothetical protein